MIAIFNHLKFKVTEKGDSRGTMMTSLFFSLFSGRCPPAQSPIENLAANRDMRCKVMKENK
jgi:hypothetical protein